MDPAAVEFRNVSIAFGEQMVLNDLIFSVPRGGMRILLGASGSGKSVLLKLILGMLRPDAGTILVNGERIDTMDEHDLLRVREDIGMVFQDNALFDSLTVAENVGYELTEVARWPTGKLRVAFLLVPIYAGKDPVSGDLKGVAVDLGKELARRVGVPFEPVVYANVPEMMGGAKSGQWDVVLIGIDAQRATVVDFSAPFMNVEQGYLVRAGVPITTASAVDAPGVRVGVLEKSSLDILLSKTLKNAVLVRARTLPENYALLDAGKTDVMGGNQAGSLRRG